MIINYLEVLRIAKSCPLSDFSITREDNCYSTIKIRPEFRHLSHFLQELDIIYKIPHCVPISAHHKWNFDDLLEKMWEYLNLTRM